MENQLTIRSMVVGAVGSALITMGFMFVALKSCSLLGTILFATLVSVFALKLFGNTNKHEINITQTSMITGGMVAGGLSFTFPGIWIINHEANISFGMLLIITMAGVSLGLIFTALMRKHFLEDEKLPFVLGVAGAETIEASQKGGYQATTLFASLGISAIITYLRDGIKVIPDIILNSKLSTFGSSTGIKLSPLLLAIGYMVGVVPVAFWLLGGLVGDTGIIVLGQIFDFWDKATAINIKQSIGIGLMIGAAVGIIIKSLIPKIKNFQLKAIKKNNNSIIKKKWISLIVAIVFFSLTIFCDFNIVLSILIILGTWLATAMAVQSSGYTGVNPMEIFGIFTLLIIRSIVEFDVTTSFYIITLITVACGVCGSVMNDYKTGQMFNTNPKFQWVGQAVGGIIGALISVAVLYIVFIAYGAGSFGSDIFPSAQASIVATMISGISNINAFIIGILVGIVLYLLKVPVMILGLGVYLPFYMSITVAIGGVLRFLSDNVLKKNDIGTTIAAGALGGEAFMGVILAVSLAINVMF